MRVWAFPSFYPYDHPGMSWSGIFAHRQYKGLVQNGAEVNVMMPVPWNPPFPFALLHQEWKTYAELNYPEQRVYDGIPVYHPRIANLKPNRFVKKTFLERYTEAVAGFFIKHKIVLDPSNDIFFSQWLPNSFLVQHVARVLGVKSAVLSIGDDVVVYPHESEGAFNNFKKTLTEADLRFACADYLGKEANKLIGQDLSYDVINWGVDHNFFKPGNAEDIALIKKEYGIPTDKTIILTVGTAIVRKGWLDLFDALKEVKKVNDRFFQIAIHAGASAFDLDEEAGKRGLSEHFLNLGEKKPSIMARLFNAADIFCLPSHWEGLANVVIEAMASGLPVITTNVCGHPEIIKSGENGILIPPKRPDILSNELLVLLNNEAIRKSLGANARDFIVNKWGDFSDNSRKLYSIMQRSLSK